MHKVIFYSDIIEVCKNYNNPIRNLPKDVILETTFKSGKLSPTFNILHYHDELIVYFDGTRLSINDIAIDLWFTQAPFLNGYCHKGFLNASTIALQILEPFISKASQVTLIGHSLGGACASIIASILTLERGMKNVKAFTLACPGIFSREIAERTKGFITTFVRPMDPIPHIFRLKRGLYGIHNAFSEEKKYSADTVPGRVIMLSRGGSENESESEKGVEANIVRAEDLEMSFTKLFTFIEHSQRYYLRELMEIYGSFSDSERSVVDGERPERAERTERPERAKQVFTISDSVMNRVFGRRAMTRTAGMKFTSSEFWSVILRACKEIFKIGGRNGVRIGGDDDGDYSREAATMTMTATDREIPLLSFSSHSSSHSSF